MTPRALSPADALNLAGSTPHPPTGVRLPYNALDWGGPVLASLHGLSALHAAGLHTRLMPYRTQQPVGAAPIEDALGVTAGTAVIGGTARSYAGSTAAVTAIPDDATTRVWAAASQTDPAAAVIVSGPDWPAVEHLPLCAVTRTAGLLAEPDRSPLWNRLLDAALVPPPAPRVAAPVADPPDPATAAELRATLAALLSSLRAAGLLSA